MQALHVDASPLNSKKIHEKHQLKEAYSDFWNNNIKFKKGWESPAIEYKEVQDLLDEAADISIRIRSSLDDKDNSFKLRMIDGSARELLWDKCNNRDPLNDPQQFVRDIVHATFKDANGYVEGLSEEKIDELIEQYYQSQLNPHSSALDHNLVHNLNSAWKTAQENVNSLFNLDILQLPPSDAPVYKVNHQALHSLLRDLERLSQKAVEIKKQQENPPMKVEEVAPSSISEESSKGPTIEEVAEPKEEEEKQQQNTNNKEEEEEEEKPTEGSEATVEEVPADKMEEDNAKEEEIVEEQQQEEVPAEAVQVEDVTGPVEEPVTPEPMNTTPENPPTVEHPEDKAILKIKVVAEGVDNLKKDIKSLHEVADNLNIEQLEETPEGKKTVQALQKKCLLYSEQLLKDLMSLDEIVNTPEARPLRKQQVQVIQSLMEDVDNLNSRLKTFLQHFVEKEKEEEEKRKAEEAKRKEEEAQQKQEEVEEEEEEEPQQTTSPTQERVLNLWKNLKLKPRMEVKEAPDAYIINSFIPGMRRDDIEISLGNNKRTISIAGIREPSAEEQAQLRLAVQKRLKTGGGYFHPEEDMETMLLKAGAGRFGRFEETYELPRDADVDNVGASYERGILSVTIPKIRKQNRMWGRPNYGHPSAFMNDRDFWW